MTRIHRLFETLKPVTAWTAVLLLAACAGYGKVRPMSPEEGNIRKFIDTRFDEMYASYCGDPAAPTAILFNLKSTPRLGGPGWISVSGKEQLLQLVSAARTAYRGWGLAATGPRLSEILDGNDRTLGYLYSPVDYTPIRPDGESYRVDTITRRDILEKANPNIRGAGA